MDPQPSRSHDAARSHNGARVVPLRSRARQAGLSIDPLETESQQQQQISSSATPPSAAADQQTREAPALTASEARLARWLEKRLGFIAADPFVRGRANTILRALHGSGILYWEPRPNDLDPPGWRNSSRYRNPAGFLQYLIRQMEGRS